MLRTLSFQLSLFLILTLLLNEINVDPKTLCGTHFQSVGSTLILANKKVSLREGVLSS
jgi:hypothetical protein